MGEHRGGQPRSQRDEARVDLPSLGLASRVAAAVTAILLQHHAWPHRTGKDLLSGSVIRPRYAILSIVLPLVGLFCHIILKTITCELFPRLAT